MSFRFDLHSPASFSSSGIRFFRLRGWCSLVTGAELRSTPALTDLVLHDAIGFPVLGDTLGLRGLQVRWREGEAWVDVPFKGDDALQ